MSTTKSCQLTSHEPLTHRHLEQGLRHRPMWIQDRTTHNRILALMAHTTRYAFKGESRLAHDAGVSKSAVCRFLNGQSSPSYVLVALLTQALERALGKRLDPRELVSLDGTYPTASVCQLASCTGCLPAEAFDNEGNLKPEFKGIKPGEWSLSRPVASHQFQAEQFHTDNHPRSKTALSSQEAS